MLPELKYLPVNWVDGMKISDRHFKQMELALADSLRDGYAVGLNKYNFGLLPPAPDQKSSFDLQVNIDGARLIRASLVECRAITPGGARIELTRNNPIEKAKLEASYKVKSPETTKFDIVLVADPFAQKPAGSSDPDESPFRHPHAVADYRIEIVPSEQVNQQVPSLFNITIGKVDVGENEITFDENYIPPCTSINSYRPLTEYYGKLGQALFDSGTYATTIIRIVKGQEIKTALALNVMFLAEQVMIFITQNLPNYRWSVSQEPPISMFEKFFSLAYALQSSENSIPNKQKEDMFGYFQRTAQFSQGQFDTLVTSLINHNYNHQNIYETIVLVNNFMSAVVKLLKKLSTLEFIGEEKDMTIVIGETKDPVKSEEKKSSKPGWSFIE